LIPMAALVTLAVREYGLRTRFGRAVVIVFTGSLLWGAGDLLYTIRASCAGWQRIGCGPFSPDPPYPSWSDIGYLLGPALWAAAIILLWRSIGIGWRELGRFAWMPVAMLLALAVAAMPTIAEPLGIPIGLEIFWDWDSLGLPALFTMLYLLIDAFLLPTAIVLWWRSFGFRAYRFAAAATTAIFAADILYNARLAAGTYDAHNDIADWFYALATALLLLALHSFESDGRREREHRERTLAELVARADARPPA
ncbi:MAG: hypothetical protein ABI200_01115, partial [Gaiellales bacterium]